MLYQDWMKRREEDRLSMALPELKTELVLEGHLQPEKTWQCQDWEKLQVGDLQSTTLQEEKMRQRQEGHQ